MLAFLATWSATQRYEAAKGVNPVSLIADHMHAAWGPGPHTVT